ncbi:hypothetical protein [Streptomyces sp. NPDC046859]|uniref:hypothetical protein n=1 Tax=Streptomyces sp. NPDC046859 TaxID=3155734 RepID=UPI00340487DC
MEVHRRAVEGPPHHVLTEQSADADPTVVGVVRGHGHPGLQLGRTAHACRPLHAAPSP